jgi:hypothetical protein
MVVEITVEKPKLTVNINHYDICRYRRPTSLTFGQEKTFLGLHSIWAEFGAEEMHLLGDCSVSIRHYYKY